MNDDGMRRPVLTSVAPQLFVRDIGASCAFFVGLVGFDVDFVYGEPPFYGQMSRDAARLALRQVDEPVFTDVRATEQLLSAAVTVATADEIRRLFRGYEAEGVLFSQALNTEAWGALTFVVRTRTGI